MTQLIRSWQSTYMLLLLVTFVTAGCASKNPLAVAETPAQKAYAVERTYNILLEGALDLINDVAVNDSIKRNIRNVERRTTPIIDSLSQAFVDYTVARAKFDLGETTEEQLQIVAGNLDQWIRQAERALIDLAAAID